MNEEAEDMGRSQSPLRRISADDGTEHRAADRQGGGGLRVGSLFTGIGGFDLGLERAGHRIVFQCEKDEYRRRVLQRHWPGVPCYEDVRVVGRNAGQPTGGRNRNNPNRDGGGRTHGSVDLLCGGFPCQDLSVAGKRRGLAGERSGLFFEFARIADALLPDGGWVLIENVPGLLSSNSGRDFAVLLSTLAELGFHDLAWRVLDSRYLGVPQRRRRVFILARRSRGRCASEVLLEPESGGGDFEAGGEAGQGVTNGSASGPLTTRYGKGINTTADDGATVVQVGDDCPYCAPDEQCAICLGVSPPPHPNGDGAPAGIPGRMDSGQAKVIRTVGDFHDPTIKVDDEPMLAANPMSDRQMVVWREGGKDTRSSVDPKPDGPRYAACGDAVTVNVAHWLGLRLAQVGE